MRVVAHAVGLARLVDAKAHGAVASARELRSKSDDSAIVHVEVTPRTSVQSIISAFDAMRGPTCAMSGWFSPDPLPEGWMFHQPILEFVSEG